MLPVLPVRVDVLAGLGAFGGQRSRLRHASPRGQRLFYRRGPQRLGAHVGQRHPAAHGCDTDDGPVVGPASELLIAPGFAWTPADPDGCEHLVRLHRRLEVPHEEVVRRHDPVPGRPGQLHRAAERGQRQGQVGRWVGVREGAADRAAVADLRVSDLGRRPGQQRRLGADQLGAGHVVVPGGGPDHQVVTVDGDASQLVQRADVDQHRGNGEPQLHHRQQRVAAGQQLGLVAVLSQQFQRVPGRLGPSVVKRRRDHLATSGGELIMSAAARTARTMLW